MADRSVSIALIAQVQGFVAGMKTAEASVSKLNASIAASAKKQQSLRELGNAAGAVGAAAAIGLYAIVKSAASFEFAMSRVAATGDDARQNLDALHDAAIAAGAATKFSATEAADGITELLKAGVSAKDVLAGGLTGALNLAAAGELDVADAANIMATAMSQFQLPGTAASHVADLLAAAAGKAQGEVGDMAQALKYVGPVAAQMGVSIEETTGTIAELANQGILADQAGTSLRGMLTALTSPSEIARKEMERLGISVYDAQGNFVGFQGIAGQLQSSMKNLGNAERDEALGRIFGNQQITAARILYAGGAADVKKWTDAVNDNGFAAETAATKMDNLAGDLEQLRGSLETALITTGEGSQGPLREVVQLLTDLVNAYNGLPGPVKSGVVALTALVAVVGLSVFALSRAVLAVQNLRTNLATFGVDTANLSKRMIAGRLALFGFAAAAMAVSSNISETHRTMAGMLDVAGAMAAGFAVGGPVGLGLATIASLMQQAGAQSSRLAAHQTEVTSAAQSVAQALDQQTGAITRSTQAAAIKFLADQQAFDLADKVGVSYSEVTEAALGNEDALKRVTAASIEYANANGVVGMGVAGALMQAITGSTGAIDDQQNAIADSNQANAEMASQSGQTAGAVGTLTQGVKDAAAAAKQFADGLEEVNAALSNRSSLRDYEAAIDAARKALKENGKTLDVNTEKGRANASALDSIASSAIAHAQAMKEDGRSIQAQEAFLKGAQRQLVETAQSFGMSKKAAEAYVRSLDFPKIVKTTAQLNVEQARAAALAYKSYIENLPVTMTIRQQIVETRLGVPHVASGGHITGPGTGTSDSIPAWLSNGEFVVNAKATKRHLSLLHSINAQGFAEGGEVSAREQKAIDARKAMDAFLRLLGRFDVGPRDSQSDVRSMVHELVQALKDAVGGDSPLVDHLKNVGDKLVDAAGSLDKTSQKLDALHQQFRDVSTSVAAAFQHDLFGGSLADAELQARADRNDAREATRDLARARHRGLGPRLAAQVAASGNTLLIDQLAHSTPREIREFERLLRQRQRATVGLGRETAQAQLGPAIREQNRVLDRLEHRIHHLEGVLRHLPDGVERGAEKGTHSGNAQRQRQAAAQRRAG